MQKKKKKIRHFKSILLSFQILIDSLSLINNQEERVDFIIKLKDKIKEDGNFPNLLKAIKTYEINSIERVI